MIKNKMSDLDNFHFVFPLRIYIEDTDAGGIVYYANYLKFMERARTEFMRSLGFEQNLNLASESQCVVHSTEVKFLKPARMDIKVVVSVQLLQLARSWFVVEQKVLDEQLQTVFCSATVKIACVGSANFKPLRLPDVMVKGLKQYL